jgi:hypothetical protein
LVAANFVASILHCGDNMLFFAEYPEPAWITGPHIVDLLWLVATPSLFVGWWLGSRGRMGLAIVAFVIYGAVSLSVLGHYLYASPLELPFRVNFLILAEAVAAAGLTVFSLLVLPRVHRGARPTSR